MSKLTKKELQRRVDRHMSGTDMRYKKTMRPAMVNMVYKEARRTAKEIREEVERCPDAKSRSMLLEFIDSRYKLYGVPTRPLEIEEVV